MVLGNLKLPCMAIFISYEINLETLFEYITYLIYHFFNSDMTLSRP